MTRFTRAGWLALTLAVALPLGVYGVHASAAATAPAAASRLPP